MYNPLHVDMQGAYFPWKATAMGKNYINGKTFLEKRLVASFMLHFALIVVDTMKN